MRVRKKSVKAEAVQFTGTIDNFKELLAFCDPHQIEQHGTEQRPMVMIPTLGGRISADVGDWIIKGVNGEIYPCVPDIFDKTYEIIE